MANPTRPLDAAGEGNQEAFNHVLPLVYDELRGLAAAQLASENPGQTFNPTALVHEAYLRLVGKNSSHTEKGRPWENRGYFFAAAAQAMRRILIENARRKKRLRHGAGRHRVSLQTIDTAGPGTCDDLLTLDEALQKLEAAAPRKARLVELRYFAGLSVEEAAHCLGISRATADRWWFYARAFLYEVIQSGEISKK